MNPKPFTHPRHRRGVILGLVLAVALLAAACDGEPQAAEPQATPATPAEPADTPEPSPTPEPTPDPTGDCPVMRLRWSDAGFWSAEGGVTPTLLRI